jgi:alkenylglycerophosphocholine/alkenylglycerophosphoethanolamine hydrolase
MNWFLLAALICALADWFAVARANKPLEYIFKPAAMLAVIGAAWVWMQDARDVWLARFLLIGFVFSLAGDVFLMLPHPRDFLFGLGAFLLAHIAYIIGLNPTLPPPVALPLLVPIAIVGSWFSARVVRALRAAPHQKLVAPVVVYGAVISLMLFSAWATLFRPEWTTARRAFISIGATLFFVSDAMLAWNRFVKPFAAARLGVIITYHLGQIALAAALAT